MYGFAFQGKEVRIDRYVQNEEGQNGVLLS